MAAAKASAEFVACVVGLSRGDGEPFSSYSGTGKSCLCYRFIYPGVDKYVDNHESILALHEFESQPINRDHFLYWGSVFKHFPVKSSSKYTIIQVHVIEHTVFYQDETSQPFPNCGNYRKRIIGSLESPGKVSYKSRDELDGSSGTQQYPSKKLNKVPKGYMVIIDVSQIGTAFDAQLQRAEQTLDYLAKHKQKFIIVASKHDDSNPNSLRCAQDLRKKYHTILVETSASGNINIRDAFRLLAHKVLKKSDISDSINSFADSQQNALKVRSHAKRAFREFLEEQVVDPIEQLSDLYGHNEFRECKRLAGKFDTGWLFATHILQLYNEEYSSKEDADRAVTRREYLENIVKERPDLFTYSHHLKSWIEFYIGEDQEEDKPVSDTQEQELQDEESTDTVSPKRASGTGAGANTHAWVTIVDRSSTDISRQSSTVSNDSVSQKAATIDSVKSDHDSVSMSSEDGVLEFEPQTLPVQHTMGDHGGPTINSESRLSATDRERHSDDCLEQHSYEPIDDQPIHDYKGTSMHTSAQRPLVKLKANLGKEQNLISSVDTDLPPHTAPQQRTQLNMAAPARHDYENRTLSFQLRDGQASSFPPRSATTAHTHGQLASPPPSSRQEIFIERKNFQRLDTPRTMLAKKMGMFQEMPMTQTATTGTKRPELPGATTQARDYENHLLPFERSNEESTSALLPSRSLPRMIAAQTHVGSPPHPRSIASTKAVASTPPPRQETNNIMEQIVSNTTTQRCDYENHSLTLDERQNKGAQPLTTTRMRSPLPTGSTSSRQIETPWTLLADGNKEKAQQNSNKNPSTSGPESPISEETNAEEPHVRHNYENHSLKKFEHPNTTAGSVGASLPPRSLTVANQRSLPSSTPRQSETFVADRKDFRRLATPSTMKRLASLPSGKPSSPTPDYVDDDYINTALLSMSGLPSPSAKSSGGTLIESSDYDYVDEDYVNTASASALGLAAQTDIVDEADYVNTTPPTSMKRGTRPPIPDGDDKEDDFVYDYPDLRNPRLLFSPTSHRIRRTLHSMKSAPLSSSWEGSLPPRGAKRRAVSEAATTQHHLTAIPPTAMFAKGTSDKRSDKNGHKNSFGKGSMNVSSMSRQDSQESDYVSGYVNTKLERPLPCRKTKRNASPIDEGENPIDSDEELEYDYPNIERRIRFDFGPSHQKKLAGLPPRKENITSSSTTFSSGWSQLTSSKSGSGTSGVNRPLPKWWLQLIKERERKRDNPDLYLHFATGRRKSYQQPVINLPPRQDLYTLQEQQYQQNAPVWENSESLGIDTDEYIVMASAGCTVDDNYVNWETIYNSREYYAPSSHTLYVTNKTLPPRKGVAKDTKSRRYSIDDMQVNYYNVSIRNIPPRARESIALPPRGVRRTIPEEQTQECDLSKKQSSTAVETPQSVGPKPESIISKKQLSVVEAPQSVKPKPECDISKKRYVIEPVQTVEPKTECDVSKKQSSTVVEPPQAEESKPECDVSKKQSSAVVEAPQTVEPKPECDTSKKRLSVVEAPQTATVKPQVKPKPVGFLGKQTSGSLSHSDESNINKPKPKPKPKLRPKPKIGSSAKPPLTRTATNSSTEEITKESNLVTKSAEQPHRQDSSSSLHPAPARS